MVRFRIECELPFSRENYWRIRAARGFHDFVVEDGLLKEMEASPVETDQHGWSTRVQHYCPAHVDCPAMIRTVVGDTMFAVDDHQRWNDHVAPFRQDFTIRPSFLTNISKTAGVLLVEECPEPQSDFRDAREKALDADDDEHPLPITCDSTAAEDAVLTSAAEYDADDAVEGGHEEHLSSVDDSTDAEGSENDESPDVSDAENGKESLDVHAVLCAISPAEKSRHVVLGETRVSIPTLGWFIERATVHNLRNFYKGYPATVTRFRRKLYRQFAGGDESVPCNIVVDRFLENEARRSGQAQVEKTKSNVEKEEIESFENDDLEYEDDSDNDLLCVE